MEKYGTARQTTDDNIIRRMRFAFWIAKATDTHSEYVILIVFARQQWLRERASALRYTLSVLIVKKGGRNGLHGGVSYFIQQLSFVTSRRYSDVYVSCSAEWVALTR